jgi:lipopolysaccharide biosynthesis regulator YciM
MKPLNTEERRKSFSAFLAFFIVTVAVIVLAVYFGVQVPARQNERLKEQVAHFQRENAFADVFSDKLTETKLLLDSVNKNGVQATLIDGQIGENVKRLNAMVDADSSANKSLYHNMVQSLVDLQIAKQGLREASSKDANLASTTQEITELRMKNAQLETQNLQYLQMLRSAPAPVQRTQPQAN